MTLHKTSLFNEELQSAAILFKALAHPARLAILQYLAETRTCITGDIAGEIPLSRTTVNQHLKELKDAGLIQGTTEGVKTNYCLNPLKVAILKQVSEELLEKINNGSKKGSRCR
jgi:ArsR family transcriptional regulator, arsenate/arsenite/antimonite-responsive transcriptional repressor